jgi:biotin-(acetyl-CoA carboxylase) ligase
MAPPQLPPPYRAIAVEPGVAPFVHACGLARERTEDGVLVWSRRTDRLDSALVMQPDSPLPDTLPILYALFLAVGDALGALLPPIVAVHFRWPDRVEVNGTLAGGLRVAWATVSNDLETPAWLVAGITIAIASASDRFDVDPDRTTLQDEGGGDIGAIDLLEAVARHLLVWLNRWQDDGLAPLCTHWVSRAAGLADELDLSLPDERLTGRFAGLDDMGRLRLSTGGVIRTIPLERALAAPTWAL